MTTIEAIKAQIRTVPDFPKAGIEFKDITPLLLDHELCNQITLLIAEGLKDTSIDAVAGIESRGFLFGMLLSQKLQVPFVPIRKKGKLPYKTIQEDYTLEYGTATIEMHEDAISPGMNVLIHDDLLATGGTAAAAAELILKLGGNIAAFNFIIELSFLNGIDRLKPYQNNVVSLVNY